MAARRAGVGHHVAGIRFCSASVIVDIVVVVVAVDNAALTNVLIVLIVLADLTAVAAVAVIVAVCVSVGGVAIVLATVAAEREPTASLAFAHASTRRT